ncbi:MAG: glycosyltransferase family 4 protein [Luteolibacter sp.]
MSRLSILQIFNRYLQYGGEEGSVFRIGDALQELHDVEYFISSSDELLRGGFFHKLRLPFLAFYNPALLKKLKNYQKVGRFDCWMVHNVFPGISPGAYALAFRLGVPVVHYLHNYKLGCVNGFMFHHGRENRDCLGGNFWPAIRDKTWRDSRVLTAVMAGVIYHTRKHLKLLDRVTHWIAISEAQKRIHVEMGIPEERISVVHHFYESPAHREMPAFPENGHALFVGRLSPEKGVDHLLHAWALVPKERKLVIMGDGPELSALQRLAQRLQLENVTFTGFISHQDQLPYWANAAFSVVPSVWQEPFGMVVLESWSYGRPVVAHHIGALPEIIREGEDGFLADPSNGRHLAERLETAFSQGTKLEVMGKNGFTRLATDFSREKWLAKIGEVYRKALRKKEETPM